MTRYVRGDFHPSVGHVASMLLFGAVALACGPDRSAARAPTGSEGVAPSASQVGDVTPPPEASPPRRPFEIHNSCAEVVTLVIGDAPEQANAARHTLAPSATVEGSRDADGTQRMWLVDSSGVPLVRVVVTRGMRRVEVGRSCRTLDAR